MSAEESNIQVIVRVRPRNETEIRTNSIPIISSDGLVSHQLSIKINSSVTDTNTKTYSFDKVFGPDADQQKVFNEIVTSMLDEVLQGYTSTIFAYGQTGSGKTHTMMGPSVVGDLAGIIPRTLSVLFNRLEKDSVEFSFRVSYIELYNEELKDLLSPDDDTRKLRIFEDNHRKGSIVIQNLEEVLVKSASDVMEVLKKGSGKRQVAATKMNETSSRSHCIFSITVHIKENTPDGEELLKVGKLNLVDLAGSENIGRSGALQQRAKEAGMINQSLLTLGRVINALVEHSPHIPYRESKLTRILQDSLGGRTKTCIIANVSPAKCNLEETLSTLDYAHRAKNIRNRPEVNQKMTKRALIREYINEIEKLKADLVATREKNGIFMNPQTYNQLMEEQLSRQARLEELGKSVQAKEELMKHYEVKHQRNVELLSEKDAQLKSAMKELDDKKEELKRTFGELLSMQRQILEQKILTNVHAVSENRLHSIATGLVTTLNKSVEDLDGLHHKLDRKREVESVNLDRFGQFQSNLYHQLEQLATQLELFLQYARSGHNCLESKLLGMSREQEDICAKEGIIQQTEFEMRGSEHQQLSSSTSSCITKSMGIVEELKKSADGLFYNVEKKKGEGDETCAAFSSALDSLLVNCSQSVASMIEGMKLVFDTMVAEVVKFSRLQDEACLDLKQRMETEMLSYQQTLESRHEKLKKDMVEERKADSLKQKQVLESIVCLFQEMEQKRENTMEETITSLDSTLSDSKLSLNSVLQFQRDRIDELALQNTEFSKLVTRSAEDACISQNLKKENVLQIVESTKAAWNKSREDVSKIHVDLVESTGLAVDGMAWSCDNISSRLQDLSKTHDSFLASMAEVEKLRFEQGQQRLHIVKMNSRKMIEETKSANSALCEGSSEFAKNQDQQLQGLKTLVEENELQQDAATGQTPRKKRIIVPQSWKVSAKHEDILKAVREKRLFDEGITTTTTSYSSSSTTTTSTPSSETIDTATATADYVQMQVSPPLDVIEANPSLFFVETNVISEDHATPRKETNTVDFLIERHYVIVSVASVTMLCMGIYYVGGKKRKRAKRPSIRYGSLPKPKPKLYKVPLAAEPINQVLLSSDAVVFGVQIDHKKVQMTVANLLTNAACTAVDASPHCLRLPAFPQQVQHIINEIKNAKVQGKILLVEGAVGIGKGYACLHWVAEENSRPAFYIRLSKILEKQHGESGRERGDDEEVSSDSWRKHIERVLGYPIADQEDGDDQSASYTLSHLYVALQTLRRRLASPPLLVLDDVQLLFFKRSPLSSYDDDVREFFEWLRLCCKHDLLDVVLVTSQKSVLGALKTLYRKHEDMLSFVGLDSVEDDIVEDYLLKKVNKIIGEDVLVSRRFTEESAAHFINTFDANLTELERYVASLYTVQEFIIQRQQETLHEMYRASERSLLGVEQHLLRDVILKLILGNGAVSVHQLDKERLEVVESLLESRFLRWRCVKVKKRQKRLTRIGSNDSSTSVGCSMPESLSDEFDTSLSTSSSSDLLYMYRMEGVEVVWQNILVGRAFEQWFNETF